MSLPRVSAPSGPTPRALGASPERSAASSPGPSRGGSSARVEISPEAARLRARGALVRGALEGAEDAVTPEARARFEEAGRSDYLASIAQPVDLSPEATAQRILSGITGYIRRGFRLAHPEPSAEQLAGFERGVRRGVARGLEQARALLEGLQALDPERAGGIERTESLLREGLDRFFAAGPSAAGAPRRS